MAEAHWGHLEAEGNRPATEPELDEPLDADQVEFGPPTWSKPAAAASGPQRGAKANLDAALGALERVRLSAIPHRDLADIAVYVVERDS